LSCDSLSIIRLFFFASPLESKELLAKFVVSESDVGLLAFRPEIVYGVAPNAAAEQFIANLDFGSSPDAGTLNIGQLNLNFRQSVSSGNISKATSAAHGASEPTTPKHRQQQHDQHSDEEHSTSPHETPRTKSLRRKEREKEREARDPDSTPSSPHRRDSKPKLSTAPIKQTGEENCERGGGGGGGGEPSSPGRKKRESERRVSSNPNSRDEFEPAQKSHKRRSGNKNRTKSANFAYASPVGGTAAIPSTASGGVESEVARQQVGDDTCHAGGGKGGGGASKTGESATNATTTTSAAVVTQTVTSTATSTAPTTNAVSTATTASTTTSTPSTTSPESPSHPANATSTPHVNIASALGPSQSLVASGSSGGLSLPTNMMISGSITTGATTTYFLTPANTPSGATPSYTVYTTTKEQQPSPHPASLALRDVANSQTAVSFHSTSSGIANHGVSAVVHPPHVPTSSTNHAAIIEHPVHVPTGSSSPALAPNANVSTTSNNNNSNSSKEVKPTPKAGGSSHGLEAKEEKSGSSSPSHVLSPRSPLSKTFSKKESAKVALCY
jgi:hypothetical protein